MRLGQIDGKFVAFPTQDELEESDLDLIVSGSKDAILMIEGFAREMPEDRHGRGDSRRARLHPRDLRPAVGAVRESATSRSRTSCRRRTTVCSTSSRAATTPSSKRPSRPSGKQARAEAVKTLKEQAVAEMIPDPLAADAIVAAKFQHAPGTSWKSASSAT